MTRSRRGRLVALVAAPALLYAGCGSDAADQGATPGGDPAAAERSVPAERANARPSSGTEGQARDETLPKASLTPAYLEGEWCGGFLSEGGGDRLGEPTYYVFAPDGSFRVGPPSMRHELVIEKERGALLDQFEDWSLVQREDDRFRVLIRFTGSHERQREYRRGKCHSQLGESSGRSP